MSWKDRIKRMKFFPQVTLLIGLLLSIHTANAGGTHPPGPFGVTRGTSFYSALRFSKTSILRIDIAWKLVEPEKGVFQWPSFIDKNLTFAARNGYDVTFLLRTGQCWGTGQPGSSEHKPSYPPEDLSDLWNDDYGYSENYYTFVKNVIEHYDSVLHTVIVENEINDHGYWGGTAEEYIRVLATAHKAIKDVNPDIQVYDSGIASFVWGVLIGRDMLDAGVPIEEIFDYVNGYYETNPDITFPDPEGLLYVLTEEPKFLAQRQIVDTIFSMIDGLVDGMNFHFCEGYDYLDDVLDYIRGKIDEYGVSINNIITNELARRTGVEFPGLGDDEYAALVVRKMVIALVDGVSEMYWFPFSERRLLHDKYGLLGDQDEWGPGLAAFRTMNEFIDGFHTLESSDTLGSAIQRVTFADTRTHESDIDLLWYENGPHDVSDEEIELPLRDGARGVSIYDQYGNKAYFEDEGGRLGLDVGFCPVYLVWDYGTSWNDNAFPSVHFPTGSPSDLRAAGVVNEMKQLFWDEIEPEAGVYVTDSLDVFLEETKKHKLRMTLCMKTGTCWATMGSAGKHDGRNDEISYPPLDLQDRWSDVYGYSVTYYTMMSHVFNLLPPFIDRIVIEENVLDAGHWGGSIDDYIKVLATARKAAADIGKEADFMDSGIPPVILGYAISNDMIGSGLFGDNQCLNFANGYFSRLGESWASFADLNNFLGLPENQEAIDNLHYYLYSLSGNTDILNINFASDHWYITGILRWLDEWSRESGVEFTRLTVGKLIRPRSLPEGWPVSDTTFAADVVRTLVTADVNGFEETYYYNFSEPESMGETGNLSLIRADGSWKDAAFAYRFFAHLKQDGYRYNRTMIPGESADARIYLYSSDYLGKSMIIAWWDDGSHLPGSGIISFNLPPDSGIIKRFDFLGNPGIVYRPGTSGKFAVSEIPSYFEISVPPSDIILR